MDITHKLKNIIKKETNIDIDNKTRKREIVEARALYFKILKEIEPNRTFKNLANTLGLNHATVIHSLKSYKYYEKFNPSLRTYKNNILKHFRIEDIKEEDDLDKKLLKYEINKLKEDIDILSKKTNTDYDIIKNLNELLINTKGTEQHDLITLRLEAFYNMNKTIRL